MRPWIVRALPMILVPIVLVGAAMAVGLNRQPAPVQPGERALPAAQPNGAAPVSIAVVQETTPAAQDQISAPESNGVDQADGGADQPAGGSEAPAAVGTPVLTPPASGSVPEPMDAAGPTATLDVARIMNDPSIQTAIAQFSNMQVQLPVGPGGPSVAPNQVTPLPPIVLTTPSP